MDGLIRRVNRVIDRQDQDRTEARLCSTNSSSSEKALESARSFSRRLSLAVLQDEAWRAVETQDYRHAMLRRHRRCRVFSPFSTIIMTRALSIPFHKNIHIHVYTSIRQFFVVISTYQIHWRFQLSKWRNIGSFYLLYHSQVIVKIRISIVPKNYVRYVDFFW